MLILTRKTDQGIVIQHDIVVRVLAIDGDRVKLGIDAPRSIGVLREELCAAVRDENREAAALQAVPPGPGVTEIQKRLRPFAPTGTEDG